MKKLPWLLMLHLAGCTCGDAPGGARFSITAPGEGPEGKDLYRTRIGQAAVGFVVDGTTELKAGRALRTHFFHNEISETSIESPAGLFSTSSTVKGELPSPHLYVPAKVRLGMKWEVYGADGAIDFNFSVTGREENVATFYGTGTVWTILQETSRGTVERHYLEGVGRLDFNAEVWPLDEQAVEVPATKPLTMEELALPESLAFTQSAPWIDGIAMVRPAPGGPALLTVFSSFDEGPYTAEVPPNACAKLEDGQVSAVASTLGRPFRRTTGLTCPSSSYCVRVPGVGTMGSICPELVLHGNGARVSPDGTVTWIARKWTGQIAAASNGGSFGPEDAVVKAGGGVYAMIPMVGVDGGPDALSLERRDTGTVGLPNQFGDPFSFEPSSYLRPQHSFPNHEREGKPTYDQVLDFGLDAEGRQLVLMHDLENVWFWSRLEGNRFTHPRTVGRISGRFSVQARQGGPDILRLTSNGSVDRVVLRDDEVKLEHLADVAMPVPHTGIGAFVDGDRLLIATIANGEPDARGQTASLHLFRTAAFSGGEVVRIPTVLTLTVRALLGQTGETNAVCWRATGEEVDLSTWKVNELVPDLRLAVMAGDQCVLLGFDTRQGQTNALQRISGVVPGVGRVLFRGKPQSISGTGFAGVLPGQEPVAVLSDGSLSTARRRYTRGAMDMGLPDRLSSTFNSTTAIPDLGGAGLWVRDFAGDGGFRLDLKGQTETSFPEAKDQVPHHALVPTGLATNAGWFIYPDGGIEKPAIHPLGYFCQRMSDGSWCGGGDGAPRSLFCQSPDGGTRTVPNPVATHDCTRWLPRGDGTWLLLGQQKLHAFDPVAMTLTVEGDADVLGWGIDHKGRAIFAKHIFGGPLHTVHLATPGFPEAFAVPNGYWSAGGTSANSVKFVSTPDVTLMSVTWTGVFGTADPTTFRMPPVP